MISEPKEPGAPPPPRKYRWPWVVLALFMAGVALAVLWMSKEVRRIKVTRDVTFPVHP